MTPSTLSSGSGQWTGRKGFQNSTSSSGVGCSAAPTVRVGKRRRANRGRGRSAMVVAGCALRGNTDKHHYGLKPPPEGFLSGFEGVIGGGA